MEGRKTQTQNTQDTKGCCAGAFEMTAKRRVTLPASPPTLSDFCLLSRLNSGDLGDEAESIKRFPF